MNWSHVFKNSWNIWYELGFLRRKHRLTQEVSGSFVLQALKLI